MKIIVGSKNPAKLDAVREIIAHYPILHGAEIDGVAAASGVSEQPITQEETVLGAMNRARAAWNEGVRYSIGLESGLTPVPYTKSGYMDFTACAIFDGETIHLGFSAAFEYPVAFTKRIFENGEDVNSASKALGFTSDPKIGYAEGMVGILTKNRLNRKSQAGQAVTMALIHLENPEWY